MKISRIILMAIYALNAIGLVGAIFLADTANGGATVVGQSLVVALSVISILALAGRGGKSARSGAFAFAGLLLLLGVGFTIFWMWLLSTGEADSVFELVAAIAFAIIGGSTIAILRNRSANGEASQPSKSANV
jgi:hypothetical protein